MNEPEVIVKTYNYLSSIGWKVWIDDHPSLKHLEKDEYPRHYLTIGSYIPDLVGYDETGQPFAIEAKGETDIRKGIGQTMYYSLGASKVFIASSQGALQELDLLARKYDVGLIEVTPNKVQITHKEIDYIKPYQEDFENGLVLLDLGLSETNNQLSSLTRNQLLNYFGPSLLLAQNNLSFDEIKDHYIQINSMIGSIEEIVRGAGIFGFIRGNKSGYSLTNRGELANAVLKSYKITTIENIEQIKSKLGKSSHKPFFQILPALGTFLRMIYIETPYIRQFIDFIPDVETSFYQILFKIIRQRPNMALNFLCLQSKRYECKEFLVESIPIEEKIIGFLENYLQRSIIDSFKKHLQSIGILQTSPAHSGKKDTYNAKQDIWKKGLYTSY